MDFFEVLKNKASGTSEQDKTLSGVPPIIIPDSNGKPLSEWSITGNTYQEWTPSPEPTVGNNKLDNSKIEKSSTITNFVYTDSSVSFASMTVGSTINSAEIKTEDTSYAFSFSGDTSKVSFALKCYDSSHTYLGDANKLFDEENRAVMTLLSNTVYVRLVITTTVQGNVSLTNLMLNKGNTVMAFETFKYLPNTGPCEVKGTGDKTGNLVKEVYTIPTNNISFTFDIIENVKTYTLSLDTETIITNNSLYLWAVDQSVNIFIANVSTDINGYLEKTITFTDEQIEIIKQVKNIRLRIFKNGAGTIYAENIMLNEGSEPLPYEPYGYKITEVTRGKNLINIPRDVETVDFYGVKAIYRTNNTIKVFGTIKRTSNYGVGGVQLSNNTLDLNLKVGEVYTFSITGRKSNNFYVQINGKDKSGTNFALTNLMSGNNKRTFSVPEIFDMVDSLFIGIYGSAYGETIDEEITVQLEEGTENSAFEPYREPKTSTIYLNSPLMADETLDSTGNREKEWGKVFLKDLVWEIYGTYNNQFLFYSDSLKGEIRYKDSSATHGICSDHKAYPNSMIDRMPNYGWRTRDADGRLYFNNTDYSNLSDFINSLGDSYLYYILLTPTSETIDVPQIPTIKGNCTIDVDTEVQPTNMSVTYKSGYKNKAKTFDNDFYRLLFSNN